MPGTILLSFDIEEFDLPLEYGIPISEDLQMEISKKGTNSIISLLDDQKVTATLFTTSNYATRYRDDIENYAIKFEIASHSCDHSEFKESHLSESRIILEKITGRPVTGLRMPRMKQLEPAMIRKAGYTYDSSINPTWLPGKYNNLHLPRTIFSDKDSGLLCIPASVTPLLRIPLFWLSFKNIPYKIYRNLALQTLRKDGFLVLYFHPWEFTSLKHIPVPEFIKRNSGEDLLSRLFMLIHDLKNEADFITMNDFAFGRLHTLTQ
jgi:peptidoglycan/xylan/chitin deacetylase (PgdA/CDA1 family)